MRIVLDTGHGGKDPGAVANGLQEKDLALDFAQMLCRELKTRGHRVIMTREKDVFLSLDERVKIEKSANADLFISCHMNASDADSANGIETYVYSASGTAYQAALKVQKALITATGLTDRRVRTADFYVLRKTRCPAMLIELGFVTNAENAAWLRNRCNLCRSAIAAAGAI
jgi:N-acetylmuramoyl-L-alanine amidase